MAEKSTQETPTKPKSKYPQYINFNGDWELLDEVRKKMTTANGDFTATMEFIEQLGKYIITVHKKVDGLIIPPVFAKLFECLPKEGTNQDTGWRIGDDGIKHRYFRGSLPDAINPDRIYVLHGNLEFGGRYPFRINIRNYKREDNEAPSDAVAVE